MALHHAAFVSGPSGGVVTPKDARIALSGVVPSTGVLSGGTVTGSTSGPNMQYIVAAGVFACARGSVSSDGIYLVGNDGALTVNSGAPAPSSGSRWDLIWVRQKNAYASDGFSDADSEPDSGVVVGTAGSSPTKPYGSVPAGALVIAEALVGTNIANASLASINQAPTRATLLSRYDIADWNAATTLGFYHSESGAANAPAAHSYTGPVLTGTGGTLTQVAYRVGIATEMWIRNYTGTSWTPWIQVVPTPGASLFTPSWTNLTIGNGTQYAAYQQVGDLLHVRIYLLFGSTTAITGNVSVTLPTGFSISRVPNQDVQCRVGASPGIFLGIANLTSTSQPAMSLWIPQSSTSTVLKQLGSFALTFIANSTIFVQGTFLLN